MAAISFAAPAPATTDPAPSQATSDKGRTFVSTFSDASQQAAKPIEETSQRSDSKDKDKADKDDRRDDSATASAPTNHTLTAPDARDDKTADDMASGSTDKSARTVAASPAQSTAKPEDADPADIDTSESPVDAAALAPVLDALKQAASAAEQAPASAIPAAAQASQADPAAVAEPLPATASLLAARIVPASVQADAKAAAPTKKSARPDPEAADKAAAIDATATASAMGIDRHAEAAPDGSTVAQPGAGQQLAAGGTDRALDMAKQGAWLDGLSRDIAATGDSSSTLKFQASPTHLGSVQVEIARGLEGAAVTLTASNEGARSALADARPQLIAEARAQGIHIASAQVDVSTDSRQSNSGSQPDQRHDPRGGTSFSSQGGGEGRSNGQSQTRSQPFAINQTSESQPAATAEAEETSASPAPTGGMYA